MEYPRLSPPYDNVRQAYQHLLRYDKNPNTPKESPNCPVVLFVRNRYINYRPYESFEAVSRYMNSSVFYKNVVVSVDHLRQEYRELQCRKMYRMVTGNRLTKEDAPDAYEVVWSLFQEKSPVTMKARTRSSQGNSYLFNLHAMANTEEKFPRQCNVIIAAVLAAQRTAYTLSELKFFANDLHKHGLKTKQDPFKILQFYLPKLHDANLVEYPRKKYSDNNEEE